MTDHYFQKYHQVNEQNENFEYVVDPDKVRKAILVAIHCMVIFANICAGNFFTAFWMAASTVWMARHFCRKSYQTVA